VTDPYLGLPYEQLPAWPEPHQLCLPEQLALPEPGGHVPRGVELVDALDAPAALGCVEEVLAQASRTFGIPIPVVHWFRPVLVFDAEGSYERLNGFVEHGSLVVWLNVDYQTPQGLAVTTAHEAVHYWQNYRRGTCLDDVEHAEREGEAQRRADLLVPKGTYSTPRGKKRDTWFEPARRRYRLHD